MHEKLKNLLELVREILMRFHAEFSRQLWHGHPVIFNDEIGRIFRVRRKLAQAAVTFMVNVEFGTCEWSLFVALFFVMRRRRW